MTTPTHHHRLLLIAAIMMVAACVLVAVAVWLSRAVPQIAGVRDDTAATDTTSSTASDETRTWPIFITTMTHLEGSWDATATNEAAFAKQASLVRHGMDLAEEYGALLTMESEVPMAEGMEAFDDNLLQEALERGHGVGTHCDINPREEFTDVAMIHEFAKRKRAVDALVGESENLGCSGGGTFGDWFVGARAAGFNYLDGVVGFHYLALPESERPEGWDDRAIANEYYHLPAPQDWDQYFHPFFIDQVGFTEVSDGALLLTEGSLGRVENLAELSPWTLTSEVDCTRGVCDFDAADARAAVDFIEDFFANDDGTRPSKITFYMATDAFDDANDEAMRQFFSAMASLVDEGKVQWATQRDVYDVMTEYAAD